MKPIIISCGSKKLQTKEWVKAKHLYIGGYFKKNYELASHLSDSIWILSAAYGLINANDFIKTYDLKLNSKKSKMLHEKRLINFSGLSLLSTSYSKAVYGNLEHVIPLGLPMGYRMQAMVKLIKQSENTYAQNDKGVMRYLINWEEI